LKGKVCRTLAAKCSLCIRTDALKEDDKSQIGIESKVYLEKRIRFLESNSNKTQGGSRKRVSFKKDFSSNKSNDRYNQASDFTVGVPSIKSTFVEGKKLE